MSASALRTIATGQVDKNTDNPVVAFKALLESRRNEIAAALPKHITADRVVRLALTEFQKNSGLRECTPQSIYSGIIQASQLGLEIGVLGQAYLVPYNNKIKDKKTGREVYRKEAQFIPGYKGLISLARRSGEVTSIETHIVYERDSFDLVLGIETRVAHKPHLDGDRGSPRLVYGVAHFKDGGYHFEYMTVGDVSKIRSRSKAKDHGPWVTDFEQMMRKTLIRRMANYLPMSIELAAALAVDEAASAGKAATIDGDFQVITGDDEGTEAAADEPKPGADEPAGTADGSNAAPADTKPAAQHPTVDKADLLEKLNAAAEANDADLLDAHADLIRYVSVDLDRIELRETYKALQAEIAERKAASKDSKKK